MISSQRNMFLSSSLAVVLIGFIHKFSNKNVRGVFTFLASSIILLSIRIGLKSVEEFNFYLDHVEDLPAYVPVESWRSSQYNIYVYIFILGLIFLTFVVNSLRKLV